MTDRLTEALEQVDQPWLVDSDHEQVILDAARKWVTPPSDKAIEAACAEHLGDSWDDLVDERKDHWRQKIRETVEAYRVAELGDQA